MRYFIINTKNYLEASGKRLDQIASYLQKNKDLGKTCRIYLAVPAFDLRYLHTKYPKLNLLTQHLDVAKVGSSTGALVPELARASGASGSIVNHSEHRLDESSIIETVDKLRDLDMLSVVCARNEAEVSLFSKCNPDFIAIEPPELIGTGNAVSKVSPEIISRSRSALDGSMIAKSKLLCGAGIVDGNDARRAIELGAEGILVASGVVLSMKWKEKIGELSRALNDAK
jgi:triosephosphate isomerase (TIM)